MTTEAREITELIEKANLEHIRAYMALTRWEWMMDRDHNKWGVPSIGQLKRCIARLADTILTSQGSAMEHRSCATGGFQLHYLPENREIGEDDAPHDFPVWALTFDISDRPEKE